MKGETNNKRQAKLLAAVAVMAMVVCALAVAMPSEEAEAVLSDEFTTEFDSGTYSVNGTEEVTVTDSITLTKNTTITADSTSSTANVLTIKYTNGTGSLFNLGNNTLTITGNVTVKIILTITADGDATNDLQVVNANSPTGVEVTNKAVLEVSSSVGDQGRIWQNAKLKIDNATVNFTKANSVGFSESYGSLEMKNGAELKFTNPNFSAGNLFGTADNSKITVTGTNKVLNFYGMTLTNSSVSNENGTIAFYKGATITSDNKTSMDAKKFTTTSATSNNDVTLTGGTYNGDFESTSGAPTPKFVNVTFNGMSDVEIDGWSIRFYDRDSNTSTYWYDELPENNTIAIEEKQSVIVGTVGEGFAINVTTENGTEAILTKNGDRISFKDPSNSNNGYSEGVGVVGQATVIDGKPVGASVTFVSIGDLVKVKGAATLSTMDLSDVDGNESNSAITTDGSANIVILADKGYVWSKII